MYEIYVGDEKVELCDKPHYLKKGPKYDENGLWVPSDGFEDAEIVGVRGTLYNISSKDKVLEDAETAMISEKPTAYYIGRNETGITKVNETVNSTRDEFEDVVCGLDADMGSRIEALEDIVCEFDMMLNGGSEE